MQTPDSFNTQRIRHLIADIRNGDADQQKAALDEVIRRALVHMQQFAHELLRGQRLHGHIETMDVVQNAAIRLERALRAESWGLPASRAHFFNLVGEQVRREILDLIRHFFGPHGSGNQLPLQTAADSAGDAYDHPDPRQAPEWVERQREWADRQRALTEAVGRLSQPDRDLFDAIHYQGLTHEEAREALGIKSLGALKRRWTLAKLRLRELLGLPSDEGGDA